MRGIKDIEEILVLPSALSVVTGQHEKSRCGIQLESIIPRQPCPRNEQARNSVFSQNVHEDDHNDAPVGVVCAEKGSKSGKTIYSAAGYQKKKPRVKDAGGMIIVKGFPSPALPGRFPKPFWLFSPSASNAFFVRKACLIASITQIVSMPMANVHITLP